MEWIGDEVRFHKEIYVYWRFKNPKLSDKISECIALLVALKKENKEFDKKYGTQNNNGQAKDEERTIKWS